MSVNEFASEIFVKNKNLCVIDNQIIDFGQFDKFHPGGKFTLIKNKGRDITKFFNGAYKLVNSDKTEILHTHSAKALTIVNSMIIGHLKGQKGIKPLKARVSEKH